MEFCNTWVYNCLEICPKRLKKKTVKPETLKPPLTETIMGKMIITISIEMVRKTMKINTNIDQYKRALDLL